MGKFNMEAIRSRINPRRKRMHRQRLELDMSLIESMHERGISNRNIARMLGCSEGTVRNRLRELKQK